MSQAQISQIDKAITKIEEDLAELRGNAEDFENEINTSTAKEKLLTESLASKKTNVEKLEETVSHSIINLKEVKELFNT